MRAERMEIGQQMALERMQRRIELMLEELALLLQGDDLSELARTEIQSAMEFLEAARVTLSFGEED